MRLLWWRGKKAQPVAAAHGREAGITVAEAQPRALAPQDPVLALARDYLVATGARVRMEGAELVTAELPDGTRRSFTASLAVAGARTGVELLVPGSRALSEIVAACGDESAVTSFGLESHHDVGGLVRGAVAAPPDSCGACTTQRAGDAFSACDACPLREGRLALRGLERIRRVTERGRVRSWSAEVSFGVISRDRQGRLDDRMRLAFDVVTGKAVDPVALEALASATDAALPQAVAATLGSVLARAEAAVRAPAETAAAFLALRSQGDYLRRREEITTTHAAIRRERPDEARELDRALAVELQRLDDTFAVSVEVTLVSVAFVASDYVEVVLERHGAKDIALTCDAGRGVLVPPVCAVCTRPARMGLVCAEGHVTCGACLGGRGGALACPVCSGGAPADAWHRETEEGRERAVAKETTLSAASLVAAPERVWGASVRWIAEQRGVRIDKVAQSPSGLTLRGERAGSPICVFAPRAIRTWEVSLGVSGDEVRRAAAHVAAERGTACVLLAPVPASGEALAEAERLGVELWADSAVQDSLDEAARAYDTQREAAAAHRQRRLELLDTVRREGLAALEETETCLAMSPDTAGLSTRGQVVQAVEATKDSHDHVLQALVAWDTVVADFQAAVGPRPRRDGALDVVASSETLRELLDRVRHLGRVTVASARQLADLAPRGDFGYAEWRASVLDEVTARCEAARWHLLALDLAEADDYHQAHDQQATERAGAAALAAQRAAARVAQTFAALERRARL